MVKMQPPLPSESPPFRLEGLGGMVVSPGHLRERDVLGLPHSAQQHAVQDAPRISMHPDQPDLPALTQALGQAVPQTVRIGVGGRPGWPPLRWQNSQGRSCLKLVHPW